MNDLRVIVETLMWKGSDNLQKYGHVASVAGIIHGKSMDMCLLEGDQEKRRRTLKRLIRRYQADGIVVVTDCFFTQHTHGGGLNLDLIPLPSRDPRRQEAVCVLCKLRGQNGFTLLRPYGRTAEGVVFDPVRTIDRLESWVNDLWQTM